MGNSVSSGRGGPQDETVDFGALTPQSGVYTGPRDWHQGLVAQAIVDRRLAPFYRPLEDYEDDWTDEQILAARKEPPPPPEPAEGEPGGSAGGLRADPHAARAHHHKKSSTSGKEKEAAAAAAAAARLNEAALYRGAAECPICFLYYPPNINYSRCCDQAICTDCFVQIKRAEPDPTHLESDPASCPYCVQPDFGVVYRAPTWRAGLGSEGAPPPSPGNVSPARPPMGSERKRRQSFGLSDPNVVTTDYIRPDWEAKLAAVKAAVARRANRRIIMRQVGDRLIPVGISSGRVQIMTEPGAAGGSPGGDDAQNGEGGRRSRRREREINRLLGALGGSAGNYPGNMVGAQDLEEMMIAEAMRLSLLEEEERQRKEREKEAKDAAKKRTAGGAGSPPSGAGPSATGSASGPTSPAGGPPSASSLGPASATTPDGVQLPAVTGSSLLPPPADDRGRPGHRASSSVSTGQSALSRDMTPVGGASGAGGSTRSRSQPPFSALGAAIKSATVALAGVATPGHGNRHEGSGSGPGSGTATPRAPPPPAASASEGSLSSAPAAAARGATSPVRETTSVMAGVPSASLAIPHPITDTTSPHEPASSPAAEVPSIVTSPTDDAPAPVSPAAALSPSAPTGSSAPLAVPRPSPQHVDSFASSMMSVEGEAYDYLSSSPGSDGDAHEPLIDRAATPTGAGAPLHTVDDEDDDDDEDSPARATRVPVV